MNQYVAACISNTELTGTQQSILEPFTYITANPGKDMRSQLIEAFNLWMNVPEDKIVIISRLVNMLHNASLL